MKEITTRKHEDGNVEEGVVRHVTADRTALLIVMKRWDIERAGRDPHPRVASTQHPRARSTMQRCTGSAGRFCRANMKSASRLKLGDCSATPTFSVPFAFKFLSRVSIDLRTVHQPRLQRHRIKPTQPIPQQRLRTTTSGSCRRM